MKKFLAAALCALLLCGVLCACGAQPAPSETTAASSTNVPATEAPSDLHEEELYADYLTNGGYARILNDCDAPDGEYEAQAALADVNGDGVRELLLHVTNKTMLGVRGYSSETVLLGVRDGEVERLGYAEYGGGSGGGDYLFIKYDTVEKKHVLEYEEFVRDGMFFNTYALYYFDVTQRDTQEKNLGFAGAGDVIYKTAHTLRSNTFAKEGEYAQDAQRILDETDLCTQDEYTVTAFLYDDDYVSEADFDAYRARFVEPTDPAYQMKPVTLDNPIPSA